MDLLEGDSQLVINQNIELLEDMGYSKADAQKLALKKAGKVYITEVTPEFAKEHRE